MPGSNAITYIRTGRFFLKTVGLKYFRGRWQMRRRHLIFPVLLLILSCQSATKRVMILDYSAFGPQVAAYEVIGYEWHQWECHGDSNPDTAYDVKVVVYREMLLKDVQALYPVNEEAKQDYRYLEYIRVMDYLKTMMNDEDAAMFKSTLQETKRKIDTYFK